MTELCQVLRSICAQRSAMYDGASVGILSSADSLDMLHASSLSTNPRYDGIISNDDLRHR